MVQRIVVLVMGCVLFAAASSEAQVTFDGASSHDVEGRLRAGALADMNADGHLDWIGAVWFPSERIFVRLGDGAGGFPVRSFLGAPNSIDVSDSMVVADFNGDSNLDLAILGSTTRTLSVYFGDGAGGLTGLVSLGSNASFRRPVAADMNGDGHTDLVGMTATVQVFLNDGAGGFATLQVFDPNQSGNGFPNLPVTADFDLDGRMDLGIIDARECGAHDCDILRLAVMRGDGAGGFVEVREFSGLDRVTDLATGDFDGDGIPDVAVHASGLRVLLGDGTLGFVESFHDPGVGPTFGILAVDVDGDGIPDVVARTNDGLTVLRGNGQGGFAQTDSVPTTPDVFVVGDCDEDGVPDLLIGTESSYSLIPGAGEGRFATAPHHAVSGFSEVIVVGDINEDGLPDLISAARSTASGTTDVFGGVDVASLAPLGTLTEAVAPTRLVDVDDDGHLDLAMLGPGHAVKVKYGDGTGGFPETTGVQACTCSTQFADVVLWGDLNEDGMLDLVRCVTGSVSIFPGTGGRTFSALPILFTPRSTSFHAMADFNEDGHLDLAGVNESFSGGTDYHLLAGDGTGNLSAPQNLVPVDAWPEPMSMGDVDEDGHLDLVVAHRSSGILILPGNGDGTIGTPVRIFNGSFVRGTALGDLNGDGHLDLVAGRFTSEAVTILLGDGQGGFAPIGSYRVGGVPRLMLIEDLDVDGDLDIAVAAASGVSILYNRSFIPHIDCRLGTVNALAGPPVDVLFVNGSAGFGRLRQLTVRPGDPFDISVLAPPSNPMGPAPITVWTWTKVPTRESVRRMPAGLGFIGNPTPIIPGDLPRPRHIANSIGFPRVLGRENWPQRPTDPAPVQLLSLSGLPRADFSFYIQGIIRDSFGPNGATAIMNGIEVIVNP